MNKRFLFLTKRILFSAMLLLAFTSLIASASGPSGNDKKLPQFTEAFKLAEEEYAETGISMEPWMEDISYWYSWRKGVSEEEIVLQTWMTSMFYWSLDGVPFGLRVTAADPEIGIEGWMADPCRWNHGIVFVSGSGAGEGHSQRDKLCNNSLNDRSISASEG
jgi:hypothetical protein